MLRRRSLPRIDLPRIDLPRIDLPRIDLKRHLKHCAFDSDGYEAGFFNRNGVQPEVKENVRLYTGWFNATLPGELCEHILNRVSKIMNFVLKMMDLVLKMMNFAEFLSASGMVR